MTEQQTQQRIDQNWQFVQQQVRETALACGRDADSVRIIGVSKYVDETLTRALTTAGCCELGESRPQLMWQKSQAMQDVKPLSWHMIGHLQRNKVRRSLRCKPMIDLLVQLLNRLKLVECWDDERHMTGSLLHFCLSTWMRMRGRVALSSGTTSR